MNGIDKITGEIAGEAKRETDAILAEAKSEASTITQRYAALAKDESEKILAAGRTQAEEIRRRAASAASQEAKQQLLATKQNLIAQAFSEALRKLLALPDPEYIAFMAKLAATASSGGSEEIIFSAKDRKGCGPAILEAANQLLAGAGKKASLSMSGQTGNFEGGFLLKSGDVEVNCTLDAILRLSKEELTLDVAQTLFG